MIPTVLQANRAMVVMRLAYGVKNLIDVTLALARGAVDGDAMREVERTLAAKLGALGVASTEIRVRVVAHIAREAGAGKFKLIKGRSDGGRGGT